MAAYDLSIRFLNCQGLKKAQTALLLPSPYLKANLNSLVFTSSTKKETCDPKWLDEAWQLKNVPENSTLTLQVIHRGRLKEEVLGEADYVFSRGLPEKELTETLNLKHKGQTTFTGATITIEINVKKSLGTGQGPTTCGFNSYKAHTSRLAGAVIGQNAVFTVYEVDIFNIVHVFGNKTQPWNTKYEAAQRIFGAGIQSKMIRGSLKTQHTSLYREGHLRTEGGKLKNGTDFLALIKKGERDNQKLFYTYVITEDKLNFSETGAAVLKDLLSKHAMHCYCAKEVRYAGEFHIQDRPDGTYTLVIDNNSGTYAPDKQDLPLVAKLFQLNFPGLDVEALDHSDPILKAYKEKMKLTA